MKMRLMLAAAVAAVLALVLATQVIAHASLVSSDPPDGGTITTPYTLTATFDEDLAPDSSSIEVQGQGTQVVGTTSVSDDKVLSVDLFAGMPAGEYTVLWTAVTADDHAVERGTYHFNVGSGSAPSPSPTAAPPATPTTGGNDLLIPLVVAVLIVAAIAGYLIYRNRH